MSKQKQTIVCLVFFRALLPIGGVVPFSGRMAEYCRIAIF